MHIHTYSVHFSLHYLKRQFSVSLILNAYPEKWTTITLNVYPELSWFFHSNIADIRPRVPYNLLVASQRTTPLITPTGSPPSLSASVSPTRTSRPMSPRRHSISFSTSRGTHDDRSSVFSSIGHGSISSSDSVTGSQSGESFQLCYCCIV